MKKKHFLLLILAFIGLFIWWMTHQINTPTFEEPAEHMEQVSADSPEPTNNAETIKNSSDAPPRTHEEFMARFEQRLKEKADAQERGLNEWRTPIEFYGKVVDENGNPVEGAQIEFSCTDLSPAGNSYYRTTSDADGLFSLNNVQGKLLVVRSIVKDGYYVSKQNRNNFFYAGENENFIPEFGNPVVFHLRKKGQAEPLITFKKSFRIPRDGTPVEINFLSGKTTALGSGHLRVECWTQDKGRKSGQMYDWKCLITVPSGGLQIATNEFNFLAPEDGYQAGFEIDMPETASNWSSDVEYKFFLKLADGKYGRMTFAMIAGGDHFCMIESSLNPSGSRNLEFDPAVQK